MTQNRMHGYEKHNAHGIKFKVRNVISYLYFNFCIFFKFRDSYNKAEDGDKHIGSLPASVWQ
jgi:hypothetical protein